MIKKDGVSVHGERRPLADVVPLAMPYALTVFPMRACNFRCFYCRLTQAKSEQEKFSKNVQLPLATFYRLVDQIRAVGKRQLKVLHFVGWGEPLLHPDLPEMIRYAKENEIAESIDVVTNGSLLHKELSRKLIAAGLDWLRISIQGMDAEKYREVSGVDLDFSAFVAHIREFHEMTKVCGGGTKVYVKILDVALDKEEHFHEVFDPVADLTAVEHLVPLADENTSDVAQLGGEISSARLCSFPFYQCLLNPDGDILPCCVGDNDLAVGNILKEDFPSIWTGRALNDMRCHLLRDERHLYASCRDCRPFRNIMCREDMLDQDAERVLQKFQDL